MKYGKRIVLIILLVCLSLTIAACDKKTGKTPKVTSCNLNQEKINSRYNTTDYFKVFYTWDYPEKFSKQRNELFDLFEKLERDGGLISVDNPNLILVKSKVGLNHDFIKYITSDPSTDDYVFLYYGESKDGVPNGSGILFSYIGDIYEGLSAEERSFFESQFQAPVFAGNFDKGKVKGYGMIFEGAVLAYESENCQYKGHGNFYANGDSIRYDTSNNANLAYYEAYQDAGYDPLYVPYVLSTPPSVIFEGKMTDSKASGKGKQYYSIYRSGSINLSENVYGPLYYDGEWKYNEFNGNGKCYDEDGNLEYSGKFSNGEIKN